MPSLRRQESVVQLRGVNGHELDRTMGGRQDGNSERKRVLDVINEGADSDLSNQNDDSHYECDSRGSNNHGQTHADSRPHEARQPDA